MDRAFTLFTCKTSGVQDNMAKCLLHMADNLTGGEHHMLVQKLLDLSLIHI